MHSGQTRAVLMRKARNNGMTTESFFREKRIGDLAWQMTVAGQKLSACPREKRTAKERLIKLYNEAKAEYDRLFLEIDVEKEVENVPVDYGVYLG